MKNILFFILAIFSFAITSCSSIYTVKDFPSKEKFYNDFNNSAKYRNINVILLNDSSFSSPYGAIISDDSLLTINIIKHKTKLERSSIKEIKDYYKTDFAHPLHKIILANGNELKENDIQILPDSSIEYTQTENVYGERISLKKVKEVNYKNHWLGIPLGFLIGAVSGIATALTIIIIIVKTLKPSDTQPNDVNYPIIIAPTLYSLIGIIWGYMCGYTYTYQFNT